MKSSERQLRLLLRDNTDRRPGHVSNKNNNSGNLFVRLSPGVAKELCQQAALTWTHHHRDDAATSAASWTFPATTTADEIHFLPLKITLRGRGSEHGNIDTAAHTIYASFNGGILDGDSGHSGTYSTNPFRRFFALPVGL